MGPRSQKRPPTAPLARSEGPCSGKDVLRGAVLIVTMRRAVLQQELHRGTPRLDGPSDGTSAKDDEFHRIRPPVATMSEVCVIVVDSLLRWGLRVAAVPSLTADGRPRAEAAFCLRWAALGMWHRGEQLPNE